MRLDKWLWVSRFYRTRALAQAAIEAGHVRVAGERAKPAKELKPGDHLEIALGELIWSLTVVALSERRGPAANARQLYAESDASRQVRAAKIDARKLAPEPEAARRGRPEKKDRRQLNRVRGW